MFKQSEQVWFWYFTQADRKGTFLQLSSQWRLNWPSQRGPLGHWGPRRPHPGFWVACWASSFLLRLLCHLSSFRNTHSVTERPNWTWLFTCDETCLRLWREICLKIVANVHPVNEKFDSMLRLARGSHHCHHGNVSAHLPRQTDVQWKHSKPTQSLTTTSPRRPDSSSDGDTGTVQRKEAEPKENGFSKTAGKSKRESFIQTADQQTPPWGKATSVAAPSTAQKTFQARREIISKAEFMKLDSGFPQANKNVPVKLSHWITIKMN